jgi:rubrerythrin
MKAFTELTEPEILALAISNEEEDGRIYADFAHSLREDYPDTAQMFVDMAAEESEHRRQLIDLFVSRFGDHIPLVRRQDVRGNVARKPVWQIRPLGVDAVRPPMPRCASCSATSPRPKPVMSRKRAR